VIVKAGIAKALLLWWQLVTLAFNAGVFVGIGAGLTLVLNASLNSITTSGDTVIEIPIPAGVRKLVAGAVFPIGIILVVLNGSELFTGNIMYLLAAKMSGKITWLQLTVNWILTYFGNLAGSLAVAYFLFNQTELFKTDDSYVCTVGHHKSLSDHWWVYFLKGVGCNYLVCISLWCAASADDIMSKIVALWWPIFAFVAVVRKRMKK
jgi:formate/nitrite transporter